MLIEPTTLEKQAAGLELDAQARTDEAIDHLCAAERTLLEKDRQQTPHVGIRDQYRLIAYADIVTVLAEARSQIMERLTVADHGCTTASSSKARGRSRCRPGHRRSSASETISASRAASPALCRNGETDLGTDPKAVSEMVVAFVFPEGGTFPIPITPTGVPDLRKPWLLMHPDGSYSRVRDQFSDFGEWQKEMGVEA